MRRLFLFVALLMVCSGVMAQEMSLGKVIETLKLHCKDFKPYMGAAVSGNSGEYASTIKLQGAKRSYFYKSAPIMFQGNKETLEFHADYGTFASLTALTSFVESLERELKGTYPTLRLAPSHVNEQVTSRKYLMVLYGTDRLTQLACYLNVYGLGGTYGLSFSFPLVEQGNPYDEFVYITGEADKSAFSKAIFEVLAESTTFFSGIMGDEREDEDEDFTYEVDMEHSPGEGCYIENEMVGDATFWMPVCDGVNEATMKKKYDETLSRMKKALGKNYAYRIAPNGFVYFVNRQYPAVPLAMIGTTEYEHYCSVYVNFMSNHLPASTFQE